MAQELAGQRIKETVGKAGAPMATLAALIAAFGAASCCALPVLLAGAGLGTAWLGTIAGAASPYRPVLLAVATIGLTAGAVFLWRQQQAARRCEPGASCARPAVRWLTFFGLVAGAILLVLGYLYA